MIKHKLLRDTLMELSRMESNMTPEDWDKEKEVNGYLLAHRRSLEPYRKRNKRRFRAIEIALEDSFQHIMKTRAPFVDESADPHICYDCGYKGTRLCSAYKGADKITMEDIVAHSRALGEMVGDMAGEERT